MQNCVWLRPESVAQFRFLEWTPADHLRDVNFVGLRDDKEPEEVVKEGEQQPSRKRPAPDPERGQAQDCGDMTTQPGDEKRAAERPGPSLVQGFTRILRKDWPISRKLTPA